MVLHFNTSHVNVNLTSGRTHGGTNPISIHLMLMLICSNSHSKQCCSSISIHLMLMLIKFNIRHKSITILISIHLMLMLITWRTERLFIFYYISIHLMLMLIPVPLRSHSSLTYFNTSHVNVNRFFLAITSLNRKISIHLMLMLICYRY